MGNAMDFDDMATAAEYAEHMAEALRDAMNASTLAQRADLLAAARGHFAQVAMSMGCYVTPRGPILSIAETSGDV